MVFSFFSRKQVSPPSHSSPPPPSTTPSPPPIQSVDPTPLLTLIAAVPANFFHAYTLANLAPDGPPLSQETLTALTSFFSSLTPPPRLHCVRCHKQYFEVENSDRSCLVPHDDDSAEVERVGWARASTAEYETLWACCGRTVEGAGDMGPPDGWCYEGKHTTDTKRARFRADSSPHDDKLVSCDRQGCYGRSNLSSPGTERSSNAHHPRGQKRIHRSQDDQENTDSEDSSAEHAAASAALLRKKSQPQVILTRRSPVRPSSASPENAVKPESKSTKPKARAVKPKSSSAKLKSTSPKRLYSPGPKPCPKSAAPVSMADSATSSLSGMSSSPVPKTRKRRKVV